MQRKLEDTMLAATHARPFVSLGLLAGLAGVFLFGLTLPMTRLALDGFDAFAVGIGRAVPAGLMAAIVLLVSRQPVPPRKYWPSILLTGSGIIFGFPILATIAMLYVPAAHGGVILAMLPLATAMAGALVGGERPSIGFWFAGIAGTLLVMVFAIVEADGFTPTLADLLLLGSVLSAGLGYAYSGRLARIIGGWQTISWVLVFCLPFTILSTVLLAKMPETMPSLSAWTGFTYVAIMSQYVAFFFWNQGLALAGVARTGQLQLLQPFVTLPASALLLGEIVGWHHFGFALAVILVVAIGRRLRVERRSSDGD
jgi:drug/metabolite transporter (DMT)-like permease